MKTKLITLLFAVAASVGTMFPAITVRLNSQSCSEWSTVRLYYWGYEDNDELYGLKWPGIEVYKDADGWFSYTFAESVSKANIIWTNGTDQTVDIEDVSESTCYSLNSTSGRSITVSIVDCSDGSTIIPDPEPITYNQAKIGDLYYDLDVTNQTAEVTYQKKSLSNYDYLKAVTIPETIAYYSTTYSVTSIGDSAFYWCSGLTSVTIPNSVTSIGSSAFSGCSALTSVTIPNSVTSIGDWAFYYCSGLTSVTISNSVTSIGESAFKSCSSLKSVTIPNSVTSIGSRAFEYCSSLKSVIIPNSVTSIGDWAFYYCSGLTSVTIGNNAKSIGSSAFSGCSALTSVIWNAKKCTNSGGFGSQVESFVFGNEVESIPQYCCSGMSKLTCITIPNSVTSIGSSAFEYCSGLTSVTIPNSVTSIGSSAFNGCSGLKSVIWNAKKCANTGYFGSQVESFVFGNEVESIPANCCSGMSKLTSVTIGNSVTSIGSSAFNGCSGLTSVIWNAKTCTNSGGFGSQIESFVFGNEVESIPANCCSGMSKLTSVTIGNNVTSIGDYAFSGCSGLTAPVYNANCFAYLPTSYSGAYAIPDGIKQIAGGAFSGCSSLTSVTIPNSVTSIGSSAFGNCYSLTSVTIPNSVTNIGNYAFSMVPNIVYSGEASGSPWGARCVNGYVDGFLVYSDDTKSNLMACYVAATGTIEIPNSVISIGREAFVNCHALTSITIGSSVTSIGDWAFLCSGLTSVIWNAKNCANSGGFGSQVESFVFGNEVESIPANCCSVMSKLTCITIPNSVTSIGGSAFNCCSGLTSITIPNSVTSIGNSTFSGCKSLKNIIIGSSVKVLEESAFYNCSSIETITCYSQRPPTVNNQALGSLGYSTIVYVPANYLNTYKMHDAWGLYDVRPLGATNVETTEVEVTPSETTAEVVWPVVSGAATYELVIKDKNGNVICTLVFNAQGQLTTIAFNAPARNNAPEQMQSTGFSFTVTRLESGTRYNLTMTAKDGNGTTLQEKTMSFKTTGDQAIDEISTVNSQLSTKIVRDGVLYIERDGEIYNAQGARVE